MRMDIEYSIVVSLIKAIILAFYPELSFFLLLTSEGFAVGIAVVGTSVG